MFLTRWWKRTLSFFDKLEDHIRARLSRTPIIYALVGGVGIVLFWKGVWEMADYVPALTGIGSVILGTSLLLATGLLVSFFIGDSIIISGIKHDKKIAEKTSQEVKTEADLLIDVEKKLADIEREVGELNDKL